MENKFDILAKRIDKLIDEAADRIDNDGRPTRGVLVWLAYFVAAEYRENTYWKEGE